MELDHIRDIVTDQSHKCQRLETQTECVLDEIANIRNEITDLRIELLSMQTEIAGVKTEIQQLKVAKEAS